MGKQGSFFIIEIVCFSIVVVVVCSLSCFFLFKYNKKSNFTNSFLTFSLSFFLLVSCLHTTGGIACLSQMSTARTGVYVGMGGVGLGLCAALADMAPANSLAYSQLLTFGGAGGLVGYQIAKRIEPTSLPQAVAGFHVLVGVAATATAAGDFLLHPIEHLDGFHASSLYMGAWLGSITATGSVVACGKLAEVFDQSPLQYEHRDKINLSLGLGSAACLAGFMTTGSPVVAGSCLLGGIGASGALGYHMTASIGGADMPVVITLLNSYSGWALCAEGFILNQPVLTIVGALIGSSGAFLTKIMCDGMNRSLPAVILGGFGTGGGVALDLGEAPPHTEILVDGAFAALQDAQKVMITPGYGLVVAQAQGAAAEMAQLLIDDGTEVTFGVHPVAGRMPGQLNVLLAEAGVPYEQVLEMEEVNEEMAETDVVMVIGANDTVNKIAEDDPNSDLGGMPVIQGKNDVILILFLLVIVISFHSVANSFLKIFLFFPFLFFVFLFCFSFYFLSSIFHSMFSSLFNLL